ncbi:YggT family protein [Jeotgalibaca sp. MA1X17-3]|nr:YggT family protein [Jeotgalibaca sp. MA1X17-3]
MSWLPNARTSGLGRFIARLVEPYLNFFHRFIPPVGMVSFSVLFALLFLRLVEYGTRVILVFLFNLLV